MDGCGGAVFSKASLPRSLTFLSLKSLCVGGGGWGSGVRSLCAEFLDGRAVALLHGYELLTIEV